MRWSVESVDTPHGLKAGDSSRFGTARPCSGSPMGLPDPLNIQGGVVVPVQAGPTLGAFVPAHR